VISGGRSIGFSGVLFGDRSGKRSSRLMGALSRSPSFLGATLHARLPPRKCSISFFDTLFDTLFSDSD
jgi:hypothetical protein